MWMGLIGAGLGGLCAGFGAAYYRQRRQREKELKEIAELAADILNGTEVTGVSACEETLYAYIEHMLSRIQRMAMGRQEEVERSRAQIQQLITEIAHQMRTPLTNMETYLEFLQEESIEEGDAKEYLEAVRCAEQKLHFLVESFIKMSRLEHHIIQVRKEEADLSATISGALGQIGRKAQERGVTVETAVPEKIPCPHDAGWLGEALLNVLDNAVKYSRAKGVVEVSAVKNEMFCSIQVRDYGIGIAKGEENKVFQRFYRGSRVTSEEGFGIGLYLAKEIVARHGGFMRIVRMEPGVKVEMQLLELC